MASAEPPSEKPPDGPPPGEDIDFEISFYEAILKRLPDSIDVLMALGNDYTRSGRHEQGLAVDRRLCELRTRDPIVHYNLACSCALLGQSEEALKALEQAIAFGYHDFDYMQRDPDLESLRGDPRYAALVARASREEFTT